MRSCVKHSRIDTYGAAGTPTVVVKPGHASVTTTDKFYINTKPHSRRRWNPWRRAGKPASPLQRRGLGVATRLP